jgi:hypothetical protein
MNKKVNCQAGLFYLLVLLAISFAPLSAQEFNAGFYGGVTASQVDGDSYKGFKKLGFTAGVFVNREIDYDIYWQLGLKYVTRGAYENFGPDNPSIYKTHYRYLELPLSVHYVYDGKVQFEIGISPEVLLSYASFDEYGQIPPESDPAVNRPFGLSVFAGIQYWYIPSMGVGLRYTYSAMPFRDPKEWNNAQNRGYFHNGISLTLAYRFLHP